MSGAPAASVANPPTGSVGGDIDSHDIGIDAAGKPICANTLFSCLATVSEIYDVAVCPKIRRPMLLGFKTDEIRTHLSIEQ